MSDLEKLIAIIPNAEDQIRVVIQEYKGVAKIHVRRYWKDELEQWHPTQKGVALTRDEALQVADALSLGVEQL